ncbi:MAG: shikimate dehydrogenase [Bacteroidota bacterium]|nr:shikimate dehydrogenase [Bacteroidota bacterium]MDP3147236.1 shikimate dehydrogenase [Bacteroidota bacterium]
MVNFGLIGKSLSHSFSKSYFEKLFKEKDLKNHIYQNFELETIDEIKKVFLTTNLKGLNVTNPYKETIIPYLDELSEEAKEIGAVNCVKILNAKTIGYNTDCYGFAQSIKPFLDTTHERALILGTGGASKAVAFALKKIGVDVFFVTSSVKKNTNTFFYDEINERVMAAFNLIINTTPLGLFPNANEAPALPYHLFTNKHLAYDLIYNPEQTLFLKQAKEMGAVTINGLSMLHQQAQKSWEIWNSI